MGAPSGAAGFKDADPTLGAIKGRMVLLECVVTGEIGSAA